MRNQTAYRTVPAITRIARLDTPVDARPVRTERPIRTELPATGHGPVFVDPTARRTRWALVAAVATITLCLLYVAVIAATVLAPVEPETWSIQPETAASQNAPAAQFDPVRAES